MTSDRLLHGVVPALALAALIASPASAQFSLGQQRVGTSSGTFLRIGVGARAVGLGESFVAVANDPTAIFWNPAGLASMQRQEVALNHVSWPGDVNYEHLAYVLPVRRLGGSLGFQLGVLSTQIEETTELKPFGTGRTFSYSDMVVGASYARRWTDKLLVGAGAKYIREDLGSQINGPVTRAVLFDMGSIYYLGYGSVRIATSLTNFYIMESVYHLYNDVYPHFIKNVPVPVNGHVTAPEAPGLGVELREDALRNGDAAIETIAEL